MAVDKKTVNKGEKKEKFISKAWSKVKANQWKAPVNPVVAWSIIGGVVLVAALIAILVW